MIAEQIKKGRLDKGWTQLELANKLSLSRSFISNLERGINVPSLTVAKMLSELLDFQL